MRKKREEGENRGYWKDTERIRIIKEKKGKKKASTVRAAPMGPVWLD